MRKLNIKKIFSQIHLPRRKEYRTISGKAQHDWKLLSISFFVLALLVIAGNTILFFDVNNPAVPTGASSQMVTTDIISKKTLEDTVQFFQARAVHLTELKLNKPNAPDPSL